MDSLVHLHTKFHKNPPIISMFSYDKNRMGARPAPYHNISRPKRGIWKLINEYDYKQICLLWNFQNDSTLSHLDQYPAPICD